VNRVSIIIPTYNRIALLRGAIDSVIHQTFIDWELIVVDNGSTDGTREMLESAYADRVRCLAIPHSEMPADARNAGIQIARSLYLAFLDSDDLWMPEKLEQQIRALEEDSAAGWSYSNALCFGPALTGRKLLYANWRIRSGRIFNHLIGGNCVPTSSVVVRKSCLESVGYFDASPELRTAEDYELWLRLAWRFPARAITRPLVHYRIYSQNLSNARGYNSEPAFMALDRVAVKLGLSAKVQRKAKASLQLASSRATVRDYPEKAVSWLSEACQQDPYNLRARWYQALCKIGGTHGLSYWVDFEQRAKQLLCR
jgi:glycosyltransferase involved in cell wall biosynthesis